jgi:hypothetical protein
MAGYNRYASVAADLQRSVKHDEMKNLEHGADGYDEAQARQAIVHTRQDIVLLVSLLASLNGQIATVRRLLWLIVLGGLLLVLSRAF